MPLASNPNTLVLELAQLGNPEEQIRERIGDLLVVAILEALARVARLLGAPNTGATEGAALDHTMQMDDERRLQQSIQRVIDSTPRPGTEGLPIHPQLDRPLQERALSRVHGQLLTQLRPFDAVPNLLGNVERIVRRAIDNEIDANIQAVIADGARRDGLRTIAMNLVGSGQ